MLTHATGRRSSSPARRGPLPAARSSFAPGSLQREPRDFDTWLHNAEAFGHHFADLPAPASPPVQRKPDESASPYALPPGLPLNALRTSFGPEPIQGFGIPEWMKRVGRGIGGLASGAWNRVFGGGGNPQNQLALPPQDVPDPEPAAPPDLSALLPAPPPAADAADVAAPAVIGSGLGLSLPPAAVEADEAGDGGGDLDPDPEPLPEAASSSAATPSSTLEELQRAREAAEKALRRQARASAASSPSAAASTSALSPAAAATVRAKARENSDKLSGHGRAAHGAKGRSRPKAQVASNTAKSRSKAVEKTVAAAAKREAKKMEKEKKKKTP